MITLPKTFDLTPGGKIVTKTELGSNGYAENIEFELFTEETEDGLRIAYYGENDVWMDLDEYLSLIKL